MTTPARATPLPRLEFMRPLVSVNTASAVLDRDARRVMELIECGQLRWAFNLATEINTAKTIRILVHSLRDFQAGQLSKTPEMDFAAVIKIVFPMVPPPRFGVVRKIVENTLGRRLNVKSDLIKGLVAAGHLRLIPGSKTHRGPGGSPSLAFDSVVEFLEARRFS